jgi:hypothetical protein
MSKEPIRDLRAEALEYLNNHKVLTLFDILGAKIARDKPENPNDYLVEELAKIAQLKTKNSPVTLFSKEDADTLFSTFDITGKGHVSAAQYRTALAAVGIDANTAKSPSSDRIDRETFVNGL